MAPRVASSGAPELLPEGAPLPQSFYAREVLDVARDLLGCTLVMTDVDGQRRAGRVVETEAYRGEEDLACHASKGRTARTEVMYGPAGRAYVYLIYGMYELLNAVTGAVGEPSAVLIRAVEPMPGLAGRGDGPGRLTRLLGVTRALNGADLSTSPLRLYAGRPPGVVGVSPRIGVDYAGEWAARPWRFFDAESRSVSRVPRGARPAG